MAGKMEVMMVDQKAGSLGLMKVQYWANCLAVVTVAPKVDHWAAKRAHTMGVTMVALLVVWSVDQMVAVRDG
jgi:hypothetical protein